MLRGRGKVLPLMYLAMFCKRKRKKIREEGRSEGREKEKDEP
jgi:hypothetical protein